MALLELPWHIRSKTSTTKWFSFLENLKCRAWNFTYNEFFLQVILKDFSNFWESSRKHLSLIRCLKEFVLQQSFRLLTESFIRGKSRHHATCDMKPFATICMAVRYEFGHLMWEGCLLASVYLISMFCTCSFSKAVFPINILLPQFRWALSVGDGGSS